MPHYLCRSLEITPNCAYLVGHGWQQHSVVPIHVGHSSRVLGGERFIPAVKERCNGLALRQASVTLQHMRTVGRQQQAGQTGLVLRTRYAEPLLSADQQTD
jgi:hypothetical protein